MTNIYHDKIARSLSEERASEISDKLDLNYEQWKIVKDDLYCLVMDTLNSAPQCSSVLRFQCEKADGHVGKHENVYDGSWSRE